MKPCLVAASEISAIIILDVAGGREYKLFHLSIEI